MSFWGPAMFCTVLMMIFTGYPVAFALGGTAFIFALIGSAVGAFDIPLLFALPERTFGTMSNFTLLAVPFFIFMGTVLEKSKLAEQLLETIGVLFGRFRGGLAIGVVFVGALLAAATGVVGASVTAMGLISLPVMLRNGYKEEISLGVIAASGTLGQIIPPSIVLIILADQLASAADQASTARKAAYREATGEFSMPSSLDITSASAGDMFMGAFIPGMVLVGLYMAYILISALIRPQSAPPVPYDGKYDRHFIVQVLLALVPPLALIFVVLGSIVMGVATVNQAGAVGAIGAMIMGGYRLTSGQRYTYVPAALAVLSLIALGLVLSFFDINVKNIQTPRDVLGVALAGAAVAVLLIAVLWSMWRAWRIDNTLHGVMVETAKTTSMVFIILIGAAMLTSAFRGFGGEELVKEFLTGLPGGFWTQFIVVMLVIFLLGFFLDFIEIAVVVVPIVAPILLSDPQANITAVWLGVMVGLNIQTSFLTPPFGFALFYLRGVAPPSVKTTHIYKGAVAFIALQLLGLAIAGYFPSMVNYLPNRTYLTSDTAPPPMNPRLQLCLEEQLFDYYDANGDALRAQITQLRGSDLSGLPDDQRKNLVESLDKAEATFAMVATVRATEAERSVYRPEYAPLHHRVRDLEVEMRKIDTHVEELERDRSLFEDDADRVARLEQRIVELRAERERLGGEIPHNWEQARQRYVALSKAVSQARAAYRRNADEAYAGIAELQALLDQADALGALDDDLASLDGVVRQLPPEQAMQRIDAVADAFGELDGVSRIKSRVSRARRSLRGDQPDAAAALEYLAEARRRFNAEAAWRGDAAVQLAGPLASYEAAIRDSIGLRQQPRLSQEMAEEVASCQAIHRDVSLHF